jgi:hypothetical protein
VGGCMHGVKHPAAACINVNGPGSLAVYGWVLLRRVCTTPTVQVETFE